MYPQQMHQGHHNQHPNQYGQQFPGQAQQPHPHPHQQHGGSVPPHYAQTMQHQHHQHQHHQQPHHQQHPGPHMMQTGFPHQHPQQQHHAQMAGGAGYDGQHQHPIDEQQGQMNNGFAAEDPYPYPVMYNPVTGHELKKVGGREKLPEPAPVPAQAPPVHTQPLAAQQPAAPAPLSSPKAAEAKVSPTAPTQEAASGDAPVNCGCKRMQHEEHKRTHKCTGSCKSLGQGCNGTCGFPGDAARKAVKGKPAAASKAAAAAGPLPLKTANLNKAQQLLAREQATAAPAPAAAAAGASAAPAVPPQPLHPQHSPTHQQPQAPMGMQQPGMGPAQPQMMPNPHMQQHPNMQQQQQPPPQQQQQQMRHPQPGPDGMVPSYGMEPPQQRPTQLNPDVQPFQPGVNKKLEIKAPSAYTFDQISKAQNDVLNSFEKLKNEIPALFKFTQDHCSKWKKGGPRETKQGKNVLKDFKESQSEAQKTRSTVTGLLNKLTPEKYDSLKEKICGEVMRIKGGSVDYTEETIVADVYEIAVKQLTKIYRSVYASLCHDISQHIAKYESIPIGKTSFRRLLINRCQKEFEKLGEDSKERHLKKDQVMTDEEEKIQLEQRRRAVGNIQFVGELFKKQMITEKIMHTLFRNFFLQKQIDEEQLETMTELMNTVGKQLDVEKAKEYMDYYMLRMRELMNCEDFSTRVKVLLQNIIELRESRNWNPRIETDGPNKLNADEDQLATLKQQGYGQHIGHPGAYGGYPTRVVPSHQAVTHVKPPTTAAATAQPQGMWGRKGPSTTASPPSSPVQWNPVTNAENDVKELDDGSENPKTLAASVQDTLTADKLRQYIVKLIIASSEKNKYKVAREAVATTLTEVGMFTRSPSDFLKSAAKELFEKGAVEDCPTIWDNFFEVVQPWVEKSGTKLPDLGNDIIAECTVVSKDDIDSFAPLLRAITSAGFSSKAAALLCLADTGALRSAPISATKEVSLTVANLLLSGDKKFESIKELPNVTLAQVMSGIVAKELVDAQPDKRWEDATDDKDKDLIKKLLMFFKEKEKRMKPAVDEMKFILSVAKRRPDNSYASAESVCNSLKEFAKGQGLIGDDDADA